MSVPSFDWFRGPISREHRVGLCISQVMGIHWEFVVCMQHEASWHFPFLWRSWISSETNAIGSYRRETVGVNEHIRTHKYTRTLLKVREVVSLSRLFICGAWVPCRGGFFPLPLLYPAVLGPLASNSGRPTGQRRWRVCRNRGWGGWSGSGCFAPRAPGKGWGDWRPTATCPATSGPQTPCKSPWRHEMRGEREYAMRYM